MDYTTQMDAARKGIITREMELVARKEKRTAEEIRQWVAEGRAAIPCNRVHKALDPNGIGSMLKTKINVNLGTSRDCMDLDTEVEKVNRPWPWAQSRSWISAPLEIPAFSGDGSQQNVRPSSAPYPFTTLWYIITRP